MMLFLCGKGPAFQQIVIDMADARHKIAVYTHDSDPVIETCQMLGVPVTTQSVNDMTVWPWKPAAIASVGYLDIIKMHVLEAVGNRVFNCHYALLPANRGRSSVPWAIIDGDTVTGITYHWIEQGIDTGRILLQASCRITPDDTQATLFAKLHGLAHDFFMAALRLAMVDTFGVPQQHEGASYHKAGPPHNGVINPNWDNAYIERFIRAMTYPPLPYATYRGEEIKTFAEFRRMTQQYEVLA